MSKAASDWAAKRRAAIERAKQLREERRKGGQLSDDHTFKPKTNPRRARQPKTLTEGGYPVSLVDDNSAYPPAQGSRPQLQSHDSLDDVARSYRGAGGGGGGGHGGVGRVREEEMIDRIAADNRQLPSPGSDSLTYEARRYGHEPQNRGGGVAGTPGKDNQGAAAPQAEADDAFFTSLRGGGGGPRVGKRKKKQKRPEWNNDFVGEQPAPAPAAVEREAPPQQDGDYYSRMRDQLKQATPFDAAAYEPDTAGYAPGHGRRAVGPPAPAPAPAPAHGPRRGHGQLLSAADILGGGGGGGGGGASGASAGGRGGYAGDNNGGGQQQYGYSNNASGRHSADDAHYGGDPYGSNAAASRSHSAMASERPMTREELQHEVAAPKLALLKSRMKKSGRSLRRFGSKGRVSSAGSRRAAAPAPAAAAHHSAPRRSAPGYAADDSGSGSGGQWDEAPRGSRGGGHRGYDAGAWDDGSNDVPHSDAPSGPRGGGYSGGDDGYGDQHAEYGRRASRQDAMAGARPPRGGARVPSAGRRRPAGAAAAVGRGASMGGRGGGGGGGGGAQECTRDSSCTCPACSAAVAVALGQRAPTMAPPADEGPKVKCHSCGRSFNEKAYAVHQRVCAKVFATKRKAFNSQAARVQGTEAAKFVGSGSGPGRRRAGGAGRRRAGGASAGAGRGAGASAAAAKKRAWKAKSSAFRDAMRAARDYKQAKAEGRDPPPMVSSAPDPSLVPCPHCGRTFNDKAAERHIPRCKDTKAKPSRLIRGTGRSATTRAAKGGSRRAAAGPGPGARRGRSSGYGSRR